MSEDEERNHEDPDQPGAAETPGQDTEETERAEDPKAERRIRMGELALTVLVFGWTFARGLLAKVPVPARAGSAAAPVPTPAKTGRAADRDLESGSNSAIRERWGTLFVMCAFAIAFVGGVGFLVIYWSGGNNLLLGGTLALFLGGFGSALVLYSRWLMDHEEATEPREKLPSSAGEREAVFEDYCSGAREVQRRSLLKWMGVGGVGLLAAMIVSLMRSLGISPYPSLFTTVWKHGQRLMTAEGKPVSVDSLELGIVRGGWSIERSIGPQRYSHTRIKLKSWSVSTGFVM